MRASAYAAQTALPITTRTGIAEIKISGIVFSSATRIEDYAADFRPESADGCGTKVETSRFDPLRDVSWKEISKHLFESILEGERGMNFWRKREKRERGTSSSESHLGDQTSIVRSEFRSELR